MHKKTKNLIKFFSTQQNTPDNHFGFKQVAT